MKKYGGPNKKTSKRACLFFNYFWQIKTTILLKIKLNENNYKRLSLSHNDKSTNIHTIILWDATS